MLEYGFKCKYDKSYKGENATEPYPAHLVKQYKGEILIMIMVERYIISCF